MSDEQIQPPEIHLEDILVLDKPSFHDDNVAVVTGAASGIGRATAIALAANGLTVAATDIDEDGLADTKAQSEAQEPNGQIMTIPGDLTSDADIEEIVAEAADLGTIKYLLNIAGAQHISPISEFPMDAYARLNSAQSTALPDKIVSSCNARVG
jgi:3-hydroxybutyrate dehydrogenase